MQGKPGASWDERFKLPLLPRGELGSQLAQNYRSSSRAEVEEKTWLPVPQSNQESLVLRADSCIFPRDSIPVKRWGLSMFLIKWKSIKLCVPMTHQCGLPPEKDENGTW